MIIFNKTIINELTISKQRNVPLSPIWILKSVNVTHKGQHYTKVYLYQTENIISKLKEIKFIVTFKNTYKLVSHDFYPSETYNDRNVFGCLLKLPESISNELIDPDFKIEIDSYIINSSYTTLKSEDYEIIRYLDSSSRSKEIDYLKNRFSISYDPFYPNFNSVYWTCICGKINSTHQNECKNCSENCEIIKKEMTKLEDDYYKTIVDYILEEFIIKYNYDHLYSLEESFDSFQNSYLKSLSLDERSFNLIKDEFASYYHHSFKEKIASLKKKDIEWFGSFDESINHFLKANHISKKYKDEVFKHDELKQLRKKYDARKGKQNFMLLIIVIIVSVATPFIYFNYFYTPSLEASINSFYNSVYEENIDHIWNGLSPNLRQNYQSMNNPELINDVREFNQLLKENSNDEWINLYRFRIISETDKYAQVRITFPGNKSQNVDFIKQEKEWKLFLVYE